MTVLYETDNLPPQGRETKLQTADIAGALTFQSPEVDGLVQVTVRTPGGAPVPGVQIETLALNGRVLAVARDSTTGDLLGVADGDSSIPGSGASRGSVSPAFDPVSILLALGITAGTYAVASGVWKIADWAADHFDNYSFGTTYYRTTRDDLGDVLYQLGRTTMSVVFLQMAVAGGAKVLAGAAEKSFYAAYAGAWGKQVAKLSLDPVIDALASKLAYAVAPTDTVIVKVNHLVLPLSPLLAIEIIPVYGPEGDAGPDELLGWWYGDVSLLESGGVPVQDLAGDGAPLSSFAAPTLMQVTEVTRDYVRFYSWDGYLPDPDLRSELLEFSRVGRTLTVDWAEPDGSDHVDGFVLGPDMRLHVVVTDSHGGSKYSWVMKKRASPPAFPADDHADGPAGATRVASTSTTAGQFDRDGDHDWFVVSAVAGQQIEIKAIPVTGYPASIVTVLDPSGNVALARNNDTPGFLADQVSFTAPYSADFLIRVSGWSTSERGTWSLRLQPY